jgi:hypothetical protein
MSGSAIDVVVFAALAPILGVVLFWFIQLLFIESQKFLLSQISHRHEALVRFTNVIGIFFQTFCHALGYTVTRSGITKFYITVDYGEVKPRKQKKGVNEWFSNGFLFIGPFFIPAFLLLLVLVFLMENGFTLATQSTYTFAEGLSIFGMNLYGFSFHFFSFLVTINLLHPAHLGFFIVLLLLGLGIRPSYVGVKPREKVDLLYDLKNIRYNVLHKPIYLIILILCSYVLFYLSVLFNQNWYSALFSIFGWLSIISIVALLLAHMLMIFIKVVDKLPEGRSVVCYLFVPIVYILFRLLFYVFPIAYVESISLGLTIVSTIVLIVVLLSRFTNTFKTSFGMKRVKQKSERMDDGPRRIIRK